MLRFLHLADVHLGARHLDLGDAASAQRERQQAALAEAVDLALAERVDLVLVAGDLFDSGVQPRRTVERAAAVLARLVEARVRTVILPGDHDPDGPASVYRAYDMAALAGCPADTDLLTVLTVEQPWVHLASLDLVVAGAVPVDPGALAPGLEGITAAWADVPASAWRIGLAHAAPASAGDPAGLSDAAIGRTGADYLALGHGHRAATGAAGGVSWGVPGSPEQVEVEHGTPGGVLLVSLDLVDEGKRLTVTPRATGRSVYAEVTVDAGSLASQDALVERLRRVANPDQVLDVRLTGSRPDGQDVDGAAIADALRGDFLHVRLRDESVPPLTTGELPPSDTVAGAFIREVEGRIADLEAADEVASAAEAAELREVLRLGRRLLAGEEIGA